MRKRLKDPAGELQRLRDNPVVDAETEHPEMFELNDPPAPRWRRRGSRPSSANSRAAAHTKRRHIEAAE